MLASLRLHLGSNFPIPHACPIVFREDQVTTPISWNVQTFSVALYRGVKWANNTKMLKLLFSRFEDNKEMNYLIKTRFFRFIQKYFVRVAH